jgi:hypothetical protein
VLVAVGDGRVRVCLVRRVRNSVALLSSSHSHTYSGQVAWKVSYQTGSSSMPKVSRGITKYVSWEGVLSYLQLFAMSWVHPGGLPPTPSVLSSALEPGMLHAHDSWCMMYISTCTHCIKEGEVKVAPLALPCHLRHSQGPQDAHVELINQVGGSA